MTTTSLDSARFEAGLLPRAAGPARNVALVSLALMAIAVQFSIAIAQALLTLALIAWVTTLVIEGRRPSAPAWALPLLLYAGWTIVAAVFSLDPRESLIECKQLVLLLIVPLTYDLVDERSSLPLTTLILGAGACSALIGIGQYSILHYDLLRQRIHSTLGLYMTFSGLIMLVLSLAVARALFMTRSRVWPVIVMPALAVVLTLSLARNAWVGWCLAMAVLLMMRDFRLAALLPVVVAVFFAFAPAQVVQRFYSIFDANDPSSRDRIGMARAGGQIVRDHPILGVGPNMVRRVYPQYRDPKAILLDAPHLHNVPLQIAAERGLPALGLWIWFIAAVAIGASALFRTASRDGTTRFLAAAALAAVVSMVGAGMFEYNFGDSEFLMMFLLLVTLPFATARKR